MCNFYGIIFYKKYFFFLEAVQGGIQQATSFILLVYNFGCTSFLADIKVSATYTPMAATSSAMLTC
jgi:hypothetical protein